MRLVKEKKQIKKRREHINFKIQIKNLFDITTFIEFLNLDIKKRIEIDKRYYNDNNECHLKHLNFITMEILLKQVLIKYKNNFNNFHPKSKDEDDNISNNIMYIPTEYYKKDLTVIQRKDINNKYLLISDQKRIDNIAQEIYDKYKSFGFINLNFLKRKIYEYV